MHVNRRSAARLAALPLVAVLAACATGPGPSAPPDATAPASVAPDASAVASPTPAPPASASPSAPARTPRPTATPLPEPARPTGVRVDEEIESICDEQDPQSMCAIGDSTFTLSWTAPRTAGLEIRVDGVTRCLARDAAGEMIDGWCLREHTPVPPSSRVALASAPASAGHLHFVLAQDEHWYATPRGVQVYAFVLAAYRPDGTHSVFAIADRAEYCRVADVACPGDTEPPDYEPGSWMRTTTDGVRVRAQPTVAATSRKRTPLLPEGTEFEIVRGPVEADGYRWYLVRLAPGILDGGITTGWLADASHEGEPWIEPAAIDAG